MPAEDSHPRSEDKTPWTDELKSPQTIARVIGVVLFGLLFWRQAPPEFLRGQGAAAYAFAIVLWVGELLVYAVVAAGVLVVTAYAGSHVYYLLRSARRWFRLQEIRSWRAKRACNRPEDLQRRDRQT